MNKYQQDLRRLYTHLIPQKASWIGIKEEKTLLKRKYDYIVLDNLIGQCRNIQDYLSTVKAHLNPDGRLVIIHFNHLWEPIIRLAVWLGWRKEQAEYNWLNPDDIGNFLDLVGFEVITRQKRMLVPVEMGGIGDLINRFVAPLPIINELCLTTWVIARINKIKRQDYSVSIVIPARNEAGNVDQVLKLLPKFGQKQEIIFVEGHSQDETWNKIIDLVKKHGQGRVKISAYKQTGKGKADAVRLGFEKASGELLMVLDADLTVHPSELTKFYEVIATGKGEFVNGSRLVYPMERQAMRFLNLVGNQAFSWLFTWILGQRFRDTLCGTKVLLKKDYARIKQNRKYFGDFDPFGDYDLIFGAVKLNLKVIEMPIRYRERTYGQTNISRFVHGWLLLKMTWFAFLKFRAF